MYPRLFQVRAARMPSALLVLALIALLAGCVPATAVLPQGGTGQPVAAATSASTVPAATVAATPSAATGAPSAAAARPTAAAATQAPAATAGVATAGPAATPSSAAAGTSLVVQKPDNSIVSVNAAGQAVTLYTTTFRADLLSIFPPANVLGQTVYVPLSGLPPSVVRVGPAGAQPVGGVSGAVYGIAASAAGLAYGVADLGAKPATATIFVSRPDGSGAKAVYQETYQGAPRVLRVMRWSPDGQHVYFGKEPVGLGGYILFSGLTNLWELDPASGRVAELIPERAANTPGGAAAVCIDDVSPDGALAADHCNPRAMEVIEVATKQALAVKAPADVAQYAVVGGARFSPDGLKLAYGLARRNPDDEQGWVAVSDVWSAASSGAASAASRLIATSPAHDYFSVAGWLDEQTIILQSGGQTPGVWTVGMDGSGLKRWADGYFLGVLGGS